MNRNVNDTFAKTPTPHFPRSRFDMGITKRLQTQGHGRLYPFFARAVYPGDTWQMDLTTFVRMDTSVRVPLDDIYLDTYWFFVPYRIIDHDFPKILGEGEPSDYDDVDYGFPYLNIDTAAEVDFTADCLLPYLGYSQADAIGSDTDPLVFGFQHDDQICPYSLMAYYKIYNDWFRDENVDPSIPYSDLKNTDLSNLLDLDIYDDFSCLKVNRYHDYFASAMISPQKGPAVTIPLGTAAPVGVQNNSNNTIAAGNVTLGSANTIPGGDFGALTRGTSTSTPVVADLSQAAGTINELRLAFAIQSLYERRGRFGTRYIETIRGQWGIEVPDTFLERPEYLGGSRVTLNNVPVLSTENSSQLGQMAGNSATLSNGGSWSKTFVEYGIIIGLSCTRVKHSYTQGKRKEIFDLKSQLDLYNPVFANVGPQPIKMSELYNLGNDADPNNDVFAYQEAYAYLRSDTDSFAGLFGIFGGNADLKNYWHYGDYYDAAPKFSASWLKEPNANIRRTLTGQLINSATADLGHQFMFGYYYHPVVTRILPAHSIPVELIGRL